MAKIPEEAYLQQLNSQDEDLRYDPEKIYAYYKKRPLQVVGRFFRILLPFAGFLGTLWWDKFTKQGTKHQAKRAVRFREILTSLGPAYIKIGQALSTRPDVVSPAYLDELTRLQDQLPAFPNEVAYQFIEEELGEHPQAIYAQLSPEPVAAASLGQVYKGKLKTGEDVAVKVQRPDLYKRISIDIYILRRLATWAQKNIKQIRSNLIEITDELASRIFEEMDYSYEGRNAELFAELYGYMEEIYVPRIHWDYTGRRGT